MGPDRAHATTTTGRIRVWSSGIGIEHLDFSPATTPGASATNTSVCRRTIAASTPSTGR